jgi:hypothetical protein
MLPLDEDTVLVVFSRTRWTGISEPGQTIRDTPLWVSCGTASDPDTSGIDQERLEGTLFKRTRQKAVASTRPPSASRDWQRVGERYDLLPTGSKGRLAGIKTTQAGLLWALENIGKHKQGQLRMRTSFDDGKSWSQSLPLPQKALQEAWKSHHTPRPALGAVTQNGRWLLVLPRTVVERKGYVNEYVGMDEDGYGVWKSHGERWKVELYIFYSDDQGQSWMGLDKPIDTSPLNRVVIAHSGIHEQEDGTLVINLWGSKTAEDVDRGIAGIILLRSHDGGSTWGDPTVVAYRPEDGLRFSENDFVVYPDGTWILLSRLAFRHRIHSWGLATVRMTSRDDGRTWSKPEQVFTGGHPKLALLPDGGLVCAGSHGLYFSYDKGRSWVQKDFYPNSLPLPLSDGSLMVIGGDYHWKWTTGSIFKPVDVF